MEDREAIKILELKIEELREIEVETSVTGRYLEAGNIRLFRNACELGLKALRGRVEDNFSGFIVEFTPEETVEDIIDNIMDLFNKGNY